MNNKVLVQSGNTDMLFFLIYSERDMSLSYEWEFTKLNILRHPFLKLSLLK